MNYLRDEAKETVEFLRPDHAPKALPKVKDLKVSALGPPRDEKLLPDLDPQSGEEFRHAESGSSLALDGMTLGVAFAAAPELAYGADGQPFSKLYPIAEEKALVTDLPSDDLHLEERFEYMRTVYSEPTKSWRQTGEDWLGAVEGIALRLNNEVNNTSLVLAFEPPKTKNVHLFTGDAQRGSWIGWSELEWRNDDGEKTTARDLLGRSVLYTVGHHPTLRVPVLPQNAACAALRDIQLRTNTITARTATSGA